MKQEDLHAPHTLYEGVLDEAVRLRPNERLKPTSDYQGPRDRPVDPAPTDQPPP
jgi:hypothetical protein